MKTKLTGIFLLSLITCGSLYSQRILNVGAGKTYSNPAQAAADARPGDTILIHPGMYRGSFFISDLKGRPDAWITIKGTDKNQVIFEGGTESMHFSDVEFLNLSNFTVRGQTGNGMNIDDAGTFESPSKKVNIQNCVFRDMAASGNNDLLKLSGLDSFSIVDCHFENGARGGSGIDMVGCHAGNIYSNRFINLGSNSIQAKGGSSDLLIAANHFTRGGERCLNLGGSTGLAFFRPAGANYEAKSIWVVANIMEYSYAAIAYVGSRNVNVVHNTIVRPENWIIRILQESVDTSFFQSCANNSFINNIVVVDNSLSRDVNIGPYTLPGTFVFSHNLWYHLQNQNWQGPQLPVANQFALNQINPQFVDMANSNYRLQKTSPALRKGLFLGMNFKDFDNNVFKMPPTLGAFESDLSVNSEEPTLAGFKVSVFPNPAINRITIQCEEDNFEIWMFDESGNCILHQSAVSSEEQIELDQISAGMYLLLIKRREEIVCRKIVITAE